MHWSMASARLRPGHLLESKIRFQENRKMKKKLYEFSYQFQKYGF